LQMRTFHAVLDVETIVKSAILSRIP
jgi:hypothetical protein